TEGTGIDVSGNCPVDSQRRTRTGVVRVARVEVVRQLLPIPNGFAGVAALDGAVEVVPVVEDPMWDPGCGEHVQMLDGLPCLQQSQVVKYAIEHADVRGGRNYRGRMAVVVEAADQVALGAGVLQVQLQAGDEGGGFRGT